MYIKEYIKKGTNYTFATSTRSVGFRKRPYTNPT